MREMGVSGTIWRYMSPYKISFFTMMFAELVMVFVDLLGPFLFKIMIDEVFYHRNIHFFWFVILSYLTLYSGVRVLSWVIKNIWIYLNVKFLFDIRKHLFERMLRMKAGRYGSHQSGELMTRITSDTDSFMEYMEIVIFRIVAPALKFVVAFVFLFYMNAYVAALLMLLIPGTVGLSHYFNKKMEKRHGAIRDRYGKFIGWMMEMLRGMRDIKLLAAERGVALKFARQSAELVRLTNRTNVTTLGASRLNALIYLLSDLCIYMLTGILIVAGKLTVGEFVAIISYTGKNKESIMSIYDAYVNLPQKLVNIKRVLGLLNEEMESHPAKADRGSVSQGQITYEDVTFRYSLDSQAALQGISLAIGPGERVAVVGKSGSGKTTLVHLLLGYYEPSEGRIAIDGVDIAQYRLRALRRSIGIVQQDVLLFDETIRYNLLLGNAKATDEELLKACDKAHIGEFVRGLPDGLDTRLGSEGIQLSGGQKQRLSIARIFLKEPRVLIFDEATSALDYEAEKAVQHSCAELSRGRTTITIAHRLSAIVNADNVAVLNEGRLVAYGTHAELLKNSAYYRALFEDQYEEKEGHAAI